MTNRNNTTVYTFKNRAGLSLIEVLIGLTVTLIVLGAMASAFRFASEEMAKGRASLELTNRLRTIENLFRDDLRRLTVELKPYHRLPATPEGYAEIIDGPVVDGRNIADDTINTPLRNESAANLLVGDFDDVFAGTIRSDGEPFRGRYDADGIGPLPTRIEESHLAEIVWFTTYSEATPTEDPDIVVESDEGDRIRLFRRQLIIKPSLGSLRSNLTLPLVNRFIQNNDISVGVQPDPANAGRFRVVANSLQDLTRRGNRFAHIQNTYPQTSSLNLLWLLNDDQYEEDGVTPSADFNGDGTVNSLDLFPHRRASDQSDLLLSDLAAFDIRVFEPDAVSLVKWDTSIPEATRPVIDLALPTDIAWQIASLTRDSPSAVFGYSGLFYDAASAAFINETAGSIQLERVNRIGAYVDLGKVTLANSRLATNAIGVPFVQGDFQQLPAETAAVGTRPQLVYTESVFDTGTSAYDSSTSLGAVPLGSNGIDDHTGGAGLGIVDEDEKLVPPYTKSIRGVEVTIRVYEPNASQATQMTLKQSMVPQ